MYVARVAMALHYYSMTGRAPQQRRLGLVLGAMNRRRCQLRRVTSPALRLKPNLLLWGSLYESMWWRT